MTEGDELNVGRFLQRKFWIEVVLALSLGALGQLIGKQLGFALSGTAILWLLLLFFTPLLSGRTSKRGSNR